MSVKVVLGKKILKKKKKRGKSNTKKKQWLDADKHINKISSQK